MNADYLILVGSHQSAVGSQWREYTIKRAELLKIEGETSNFAGDFSMLSVDCLLLTADYRLPTDN